MNTKHSLPTVTVVTPTIGRDALQRAMKSVVACAAPDLIVEHLIVVDGPNFENKVRLIAESVPNTDQYQAHLLMMPFNTYRSGAICRAIGSTLARGEYVAYLDDDNWFLPEHLSNCVRTMNDHPKLGWLHTSRYIHCDDDTWNQKDAVEDLCQSLGLYHHEWVTPVQHFVDTNCYFLRRTVCLNGASNWHLNSIADAWGEDRIFFSWLVNNAPRHAFLFKPTVVYVADATGQAFIKEGNERIGAKTSKRKNQLITFNGSLTFPIKSWLCRSLMQLHQRRLSTTQ